MTSHIRAFLLLLRVALSRSPSSRPSPIHPSPLDAPSPSSSRGSLSRGSPSPQGVESFPNRPPGPFGLLYTLSSAFALPSSPLFERNFDFSAFTPATTFFSRFFAASLVDPESVLLCLLRCRSLLPRCCTSAYRRVRSRP